METSATPPTPEAEMAREPAIRWTDRIAALDRRFYDALRRHELTPAGQRALKFFVRIGDGWFWGVVLLALFSTLESAQVMQAVLRCLVAAGFSVGLYLTVKYSVRRLRPMVAWAEVHAEVPPLDKWSFPSGHVMNNLAVSIALLPSLPLVGAVGVALPLAWGVLRVYFGVHYLSDIVGGALMAIPCGIAALVIFG